MTYRERYAVVTFVKHFRHNLWGKRFLIRTDHSSLKWLKNFKYPEGMVARWIATLDSYDSDIEYRKGSQHGNSDALSRKPYRKCQRDCCKECLGLDSDVPIMVVTRAQANAQRQAEERDVEGEGARSESASLIGEDVSPAPTCSCRTEETAVQRSGVLTRAIARARIQEEQVVGREERGRSDWDKRGSVAPP